MKRIVLGMLLLAGCSPAAPEQPPAPDQPLAPRLPVPIRGAERMTLVRSDALERLIRGSTQTRAAVAGGAAPVEHFAARGDRYTLRYDRPDSEGRYRITPDRLCLRFPDERSVFCRFYLIDAAGKTWVAEDDRDYPLHVAAVTIVHDS